MTLVIRLYDDVDAGIVQIALSEKLDVASAPLFAIIPRLFVSRTRALVSLVLNSDRRAASPLSRRSLVTKMIHVPRDDYGLRSRLISRLGEIAGEETGVVRTA